MADVGYAGIQFRLTLNILLFFKDFPPLFDIVQMGKKRTKRIAKVAMAVAKTITKKPKRRRSQRIDSMAPLPSGGSQRVRATAAKVNNDLARYEAALMNPFSDLALGARVPDAYSFPTEVRHAKLLYTLQPTAGGTVDCAVFPHPLFSVMCGLGTLVGGVDTATGVAGVRCTGVVNLNTLAAAFNNYRVVGGAVRFKWSSTYNNASGRIFLACQPSPANIPLYTDSGTNKSQLYEFCDVPYDSTLTGIPTSILTYPYSLEIPTSELIGNGVEIPFRISSAAFSEWRETAVAAKGPSLVTRSATNTIQDSLGENLVACDGFSTILLAGTNLPTGAPCIDVEVIYHLEGTPQVSAGQVLAGASNSPVVNVAGMFAALAKQNAMPFVKSIARLAGKTPVGQTVGRAMKVLGFANP